MRTNMNSALLFTLGAFLSGCSNSTLASFSPTFKPSGEDTFWRKLKCQELGEAELERAYNAWGSQHLIGLSYRYSAKLDTCISWLQVKDDRGNGQGFAYIKDLLEVREIAKYTHWPHPGSLENGDESTPAQKAAFDRLTQDLFGSGKIDRTAALPEFKQRRP